MFAKLLCFLFCFASCHAFWAPPVDLSYPVPVNVNTISGGLSLSGNTVIDWVDPTTANIFASIYLADSPSWGPVQTITTDSVNGLTSASINDGGEAVAVWINSADGVLYASFHTEAGWLPKQTVFTPTLLETLNIAAVAIDPSGNVLVSFSSLSGGTTTVYASYFTNGTWTTLPFLPTASGLAIAPTPVVVLDDAGNGVVAWSFFDGTLASTYAANFTKSSQSYVVTTLGLSQPADSGFISGNPSYVQAAISSDGNAVVAWTLGSDGIFASVYSNGSWSPTEEIINSVNTGNPAQVAINNRGVAVVSYVVNGVTFPIIADVYNGTSWTSSQVFDSQNTIVNSSVGIDQFNNIAVIWADFNFAPMTLFPTLYVATLPSFSNSWTVPQVVVQGPVSTIFAAFAITIPPSEKSYLASATGLFPNPNLDLTSINIFVGVDLFPPQPVGNIQGTLIKNRYLLQTDVVHRISWSPSPDPATNFYLLYRNGTLIAQVPPSTLFFDDHNRTLGETDTYTLVAGNDAGQSPPITLVFP